jgi:hypothetical protein
MGEVQRPSNSVCYTPSSELFRIQYLRCFTLGHTAVFLECIKELPRWIFTGICGKQNLLEGHVCPLKVRLKESTVRIV